MENDLPVGVSRHQETATVGAEQLCRALRRRAAGVAIVTTCADGVIHGMTATSVTGVCLEPPLLLVCLSKTSLTHRLICQSGVFAVNVLSQEQQALAERFAGRTGAGNRFHGTSYSQAVTGAPVFVDCLGYFDCRVTATYDGGDHTIFVGRVFASVTPRDGPPLIYHEGNYLVFPTCTLGKEGAAG